MPEFEESPALVDRNLAATALSIAPVSIGCAIGVLIGSQMKRRNREAVVTSLFVLGAAAALPLAVDIIAKLINGPDSKAGAKRTQRGIRHLDGLPYENFGDEASDDLEKTVDFKSTGS